MKNTLLSAVAAMALLVSSCANPMSKAYSEATVSEDIKAIKEAGKLDTTQQQLLMMYMLRAKLTNESLVGTTYQEMLTKAEALKAKNDKEEAEQKALAAKSAAEEEARTKLLRDVAAVTVFNKGFHEKDVENGDFEDYITFSVAIQNKSTKDIRAITGQLVFNDLFDKTIKRINITNDTGVKAGQTLKYGSGMDYNQFMDEDQLLRSKSLDNMKIVWMPEKVLFADGTTMGGSENL